MGVFNRRQADHFLFTPKEPISAVELQKDRSVAMQFTSLAVPSQGIGDWQGV